MGYTSSLSHFSYNDWGGLSLSAKDALPPGSEDFFPPASPDGTVGNLRKSKISALGIAFMLFCLVSAGAFGIEEIIPSAGPGPHSYHSDRAALRLGAPHQSPRCRGQRHSSARGRHLRLGQGDLRGILGLSGRLVDLHGHLHLIGRLHRHGRWLHLAAALAGRCRHLRREAARRGELHRHQPGGTCGSRAHQLVFLGAHHPRVRHGRRVRPRQLADPTPSTPSLPTPRPL